MIRRWVGLVLCFVALVWAGYAAAQEREVAEEIEALKREFNAQMQALTEAFEEKLEALEAKQEALEAQLEEKEAEASPPERAPEDLRAYWRDGLRFETDDGRFKLRVGGRIQLDAAYFDQDDDLRFIWNPETRLPAFVDTEDGVEFRRARLYVSGSIYENVEFKAQYDFAGGDSDFKDVFLALNDIPYVGQAKIGHFKEPFSLEELTSSNYITFLERSLPNVFAPSRNVGLQLSNTLFENRMTWAAGVFRETDDFGEFSDDGDYNVTARVTGLPVYRDEGRKLVHLGAGYSHKNPDDPFRYRQRPEAHLSPVRFVDTGTFRTDDVDLFDVELLGIYGSLSIQGEYLWADVDTAFFGDRDFDGYYVQASYFLTGEHRPYSMSSGTLGRVRPRHNFSFAGDERGWGAWELALRYSHLDLDDGPLRGGEESNWTIGLNWYLNPSTRVMLNYVLAEIDHDLYDGELGVLQTRFQITF